MKIARFIILLFLLILLFRGNTLSQNVNVKLTNDTNNVLIGEHVRLRLEVIFNNVYNVRFPVFADTIGKLEIVEHSSIDTIKGNQQEIIGLGKNITVTCFDSGFVNVEPFIINYEFSSDSNLRISSSNSITLNFSTIEIDTNQSSLKDIKPPIQVPFALEDLIPYIAVVLVIGILYYLIIFAFGRKHNIKEKLQPKYDPRIPADLEALEQLQRLEKEKIWQRGDYKLYHSRLTDILRVYIHRRYHLNALEMTSNELLDELDRYESNPNVMNLIRNILNIADLAKFAKFEPSIEENSASILNAFDFVNSTKVVDITSENDFDTNIGDTK